MYVHICIHTYVCMLRQINKCRLYSLVHTYICMFVCTYIYLHARTYIHMYICMCVCSLIWTRIIQFWGLFSRSLLVTPSKLIRQFQFLTVCSHLLVSIILVSISLLFRIRVLITTETWRCAIIAFQIKVNTHTNVYTYTDVLHRCTWNSIKTFYGIHTHRA